MILFLFESLGSQFVGQLHFHSPLQLHCLDVVLVGLQGMHRIVEVEQRLQQLRLFVVVTFERVPNEHYVLADTLTGRAGVTAPGLSLFERIEIARVVLTFQFGYVGCLLFPYPLPVDACEEGMRLNLLHSVNAESFPFVVDEPPKSATRYRMRSQAALLRLASRGITKCFRQFWILCQVTLDSSDTKGG